MSIIIKDILPLIIDIQDWRINLLQNWDNIVGGLSSKMKLEKIQTDTLIVGVYETCWMQELYMISKTIVRSINKKLNNDHVKDIKFKLATENKGNSLPVNSPKKRLSKKLELTHIQKRELISIEDKQLQSALISYFNSCM